MAVTYSTALKTARMQKVIDAIDGGAGSGYLLIGTTGMAVTLVSITLADPCGVAASGVLTFSGLPLSGTATGAGTAAEAAIYDSDNTLIISGLTVGTVATEVIIDDTAVVIGQPVVLSSISSLTHG